MDMFLSDKKGYRIPNSSSNIQHTFLLNEKNDLLTEAERQALKQYHEQFFKEYCISDLTNYKTNQVALRWRTKKEVISGKGESVCGDKNCNSNENLKTWEVNFKYFENGNYQNTLVKLRLCTDCSIKLNYRTKKRCLEDNKPIKQEVLSPKSTASTKDVPEVQKECTDSINILFERVIYTPNISMHEKISAYLSDLF